MGAINDNVLSLSLLFLVWIFSRLLLRHIFKKPTHLRRLPPCPPSLPLIGHIHHLSSLPHKCFHTLSSKYGPLLSLRLGAYRFVLVSSSSIVAEIFKTQDLNFSSKPKPVLEDRILFGNSSFSFSPYGDYWKFMKRLCVTELLSPRQIERSRTIRSEEIMLFLSKMVGKGLKNEIVDMGSDITRLTNNITCRMAMSTKCSAECTNEAEKCKELVAKAFDVCIKMTVAHFCGPLRKLVMWVFRKEAVEVVTEFDQLLENLLVEHEERRRTREMDGGDGVDEGQDLMDILLQLHQNKSAEINISRDNMKAFLVDIFIGGTSTSADAMQWAMAELINHPSIFKRVRKEIDLNVGDRLVKETDIPNLHYLRAVVKEILRLYPPAPIIPRTCTEDCKIGGFDIPGDTPILINAYAVMRDPELWENPDEFRPERFLNYDNEAETTTQMTKTQNYGHIPFGGGRRMCPGSNLAFVMIHTALAAMVQCFDWKSIRGDGKVSMEARAGPTISMAQPFMCLPVIHFNPFTTS